MVFDKIKNAVSDLLGGDETVDKAVDQATSSVDDVKDTANKVLSDAKDGGLDADTLKSATSDLGGLADRLKGDAGDLGAIAGNLGDLSALTDVFKDISFPINKDEVIAKLQANGSFNEIVEKLQTVAKERFGDQAELIDTIKGFLTK